MGKCILIGAGDLTMGELSVTEEDYVIAVDGVRVALAIAEKYHPAGQ